MSSFRRRWAVCTGFYPFSGGEKCTGRGHSELGMPESLGPAESGRLDGRGVDRPERYRRSLLFAPWVTEQVRRFDPIPNGCTPRETIFTCLNTLEANTLGLGPPPKGAGPRHSPRPGPPPAMPAPAIRTGTIRVCAGNAEHPRGLPRRRFRLRRPDHLVPSAGLYSHSGGGTLRVHQGHLGRQ